MQVEKERRRRAAGLKFNKTFFEYLPVVSPRHWQFDVPHIKLICDHIDAMRRGEFDRLAIFMPPRHSKSETCTVRAPAFLLEHDPTERILVTGYNETMARRFSRKTRTIVRDRLAMSKEKLGVDEWETAAGGGLVARGVGTPPTGFGFGWIFVDDPIKKREEAESQTYREKTWDWYTDDLYTRLEPGGKVVLTLTRWHHDDVAARAIASEPDKWRILKLPALAEEDDPLGRELGAALWPERFNREALLRIRGIQTSAEAGAASFEALYQQNPTPREGAFFKVNQFEIVDAVPAGLKLCRAWDLAGSKDGKRTAGVKIGRDAKGIFYVTHVTKGQWLPDVRYAMIKQTAQLDGKNVSIHLPQDPGQAGIDQKYTFIRMLAGFSVKVETVSGSKQVRASPFAAQANAGNVKLLKDDSWNKDFIEELRQFPQGSFSDQVDASADAFTEVAQDNEFQFTEWIR